MTYGTAIRTKRPLTLISYGRRRSLLVWAEVSIDLRAVLGFILLALQRPLLSWSVLSKQQAWPQSLLALLYIICRSCYSNFFLEESYVRLFKVDIAQIFALTIVFTCKVESANFFAPAVPTTCPTEASAKGGQYSQQGLRPGQLW